MYSSYVRMLRTSLQLADEKRSGNNFTLRRYRRIIFRKKFHSYRRLRRCCSASAAGARSTTGETPTTARSHVGARSPYSPAAFNTRLPPIEYPTHAICVSRCCAAKYCATACTSPESPEWYSVGDRSSVLAQLRMFIRMTFHPERHALSAFPSMYCDCDEPSSPCTSSSVMQALRISSGCQLQWHRTRLWVAGSTSTTMLSEAGNCTRRGVKLAASVCTSPFRIPRRGTNSFSHAGDCRHSPVREFGWGSSCASLAERIVIKGDSEIKSRTVEIQNVSLGRLVGVEPTTSGATDRRSATEL